MTITTGSAVSNDLETLLRDGIVGSLAFNLTGVVVTT